MKLLRTKHVVELTGLSRMTIYRMEKSGSFPARRQLGSNSVAWIEDDVAAWVRDRPSPSRRPIQQNAPAQRATPSGSGRQSMHRAKSRGIQRSLSFDGAQSRSPSSPTEKSLAEPLPQIGNATPESL